MAAAFDAGSCLIHTRQSADITIIGGTENCTAFLPDYAAHYYAVDTWAERGIQRVNSAVLGEDILPVEELLAAEWYNDLLHRHEIHHLVGAVVEIVSGVVGPIGIHRAPGAKPFASEDRAQMDLLIPHLRQAFRLIRIAEATDRARRLPFDALCALSVAVFVVQADGRIRLANASAEGLAKVERIIRIRNGHLGLIEPKLNGQLLSEIRHASLAGIGRSLRPGKAIVVPGDKGLSMGLLVAPLPPDVVSNGTAEPLAAVFVGNPANSSATPSAQLVSAMYRLTPAETRLLVALVEGQRPAEYSSRTGVSPIPCIAS